MRANGGLNPSQHRGNLLGETTESHVLPGIVPHTLSRLQVRDIDTFYAEQWLLPASSSGEAFNLTDGVIGLLAGIGITLFAAALLFIAHKSPLTA